ncbi:MAG: hypothetical protein ACXWLI_03625 [Myxococcaceae bacterium]
MRRLALLLPIVLLAACGEVGMGVPPPSQPSVRQVLLEPPEQVEALPAQTRAELYRSLLRASGSGAPDGLLALFPVVQNGDVRAAPAFDGRLDLLDGMDGGEALVLNLDGVTADRWPLDRREALQGLSEREAAEIVARSLATRWGLRPRAALRVERAASAPYAAAYAEGVLRLNPALLYLAAAHADAR